jgi:hypothetical protein
MILCFYWQEVDFFKEKHKIIDVPLYYIEKEPNKKARLNRFIVAVAKYKLIDCMIAYLSLNNRNGKSKYWQ